MVTKISRVLNILLRFERIDHARTEQKIIVSKLQWNKRVNAHLRVSSPLSINEVVEKQDENLAKKDRTHDRFPSARIIPDHPSNASLLDCRRAAESRFLSTRNGAYQIGESFLWRGPARDLSICPAKTQAETSSATRYRACPPGKRQRAYPRDLDSRSRPPTATDSNPPNPKTDLRTISARDTRAGFASLRERGATFRGRRAADC